MKSIVRIIIIALVISVVVAICYLTKPKEEGTEQLPSNESESSHLVESNTLEDESEHFTSPTPLKDAEAVRQMWYDLRDYPIYPGDDEWARFSYADVIAISNPPEDMLDSFTSLELARLLLRYPFLSQAAGYDHIEFLFSFLENTCIYNELWVRKDGIKSLIQAYEENELDIDLINEKDGIPFSVNNRAETFVFEFITCFQNKLSDSELAAFRAAYDNKTNKFYSKITNSDIRKQWSIVFSVGAEEGRSYRDYAITNLNQWKEKWYELRDYPDPLQYAPSGYRGYSFDWDEYRELMNPPEDLLKDMTSEELAGLMLRYYDIRYYPDYEDVDSLFDRLEQKCDILKEILAREDGITCMLLAYEQNEIKECSVEGLFESNMRSGYKTVMAELFSCRFVDRYSEKFSEEEIALYRSIYQNKKKTYWRLPVTAVRKQFSTVLSE